MAPVSRGDARVVVGARSAVFALDNIAIIMDEEHKELQADMLPRPAKWRAGSITVTDPWFRNRA